MKGKYKSILVTVILVVGIALKIFQSWSDYQLPGRDGSIPSPEVGEVLKGLTPVTIGKPYDLLQECRLISGRNSDGDSFHIKHEKGENEFRLYFVDAPETEYREYGGGESNGKRIAEQGKDMGGLDRRETTRIGKEAKAFTLGLLKEGNFKVMTKWEDVVRPGREYCFVIVEWEGRECYLHELLLSHGLGRVHTWGADLPGGRGWKRQRAYLEEWEKEVAANKIGAWGL
ncbi:hypothetical protein N9A86_01740 [Akkermansiaceae bacterium]|nr:hypothetical protein [Akkermansiaceae bacterium]MDB4537874.1 hypothetical protein [Akkermansiaceae bacterium]